ncbi:MULTISPECIES: ABC transporter ATP-binding protein [Cellulomonas]|uniref:ABC transporter ATP-binding protein n=1 Tax=Cellulomonas TaxID=1707 RepID=UPI0010A7B88A|nr:MULTISPECIES: ATP-binding cassette domain-containing protein [Cellulomonas]
MSAGGVVTAEAVAVRGLVKRYDGRTVLDGVTFVAPHGTVVGLLGPNGSGKSTTVRVLLGLAAADEGTATVEGRTYRELPEPSVVGAMGEDLGLHPRHTAREHLRVLAAERGVPVARVDEVLAEVGLAEAARRRIGTFSLGMRQRLGVAGALLAHPRVLVLDEPANGLDPEAVVWLRGLLRRFAAAGGTVLLTSHQLAELERVVDALVVIDGGRVVAAGLLQDLVGPDGLEAFYLRVLGRVPDVRAGGGAA